MKRFSEALDRKRLALLELAQSRADSATIYWRGEEIGSWRLADPLWRVTGKEILFQFNLRESRRSLRIVAVQPKPWGIAILLSGKGSPTPDALEVRWQDPIPARGGEARQLWNLARFWLDREYPGARILQYARRPDRMRTLSGLFLRVIFRHAGSNQLLMAADDDAGDEVALVVSQALLWLSGLSLRRQAGHVPLLHILVPAESASLIRHRCRHIYSGSVRLEVWEYASADAKNPEMRRAPELPVPMDTREYRWPVLGPFRWSRSLEKVLDLAPDLIRRYPRFCEYDSLRLRGLEFAQVLGTDRDRVCFGVGERRTELTSDNFGALQELVREILYYRRPDSPDKRHVYYRLQAERWLEALVLEDVSRLFPEMAPEAVYSQIPVYLGACPGRIDILGANRRGDLVVMELKVVADADLPVQALDYWGRVIQHSRNGDFVRRGYFSEIRLSRRPPLIYLISPVFSFHDSTERLLDFLNPDLDVCKIAINEDWRCGVKILCRRHYGFGHQADGTGK